jgi:hypothetical protein
MVHGIQPRHRLPSAPQFPKDTMPRPSRVPTPPISALVDRFVADIERVVRSEFEARLTSLFDQFTRSDAPASTPKTQAVQQTRGTRPCTTPGCTSPAAGPKYGWKCREHGAAYHAARSKGLPTAVAARAATPTKAPAPVIALPAPKTATVIPADVKITKLPPGPVPRESKRTGPSMECRCPGCKVKSRGPRYDYFCADHYAAFNAEERRKYAMVWKARRALNK